MRKPASKTADAGTGSGRCGVLPDESEGVLEDQDGTLVCVVKVAEQFDKSLASR